MYGGTGVDGEREDGGMGEPFIVGGKEVSNKKIKDNVAIKH